MTTERKTTRKILAVLSESYPGRFEMTDKTERIWARLLGDLNDEHLMTAVEDLCSTEDWPPPIATVRRRAVEISLGELVSVGPYEAWEHVVDSLHADIVLTDLEKQAFKQIGGKWTIQSSNNASRDRDAFVRAYHDLLKKRDRLATALPRVKWVAKQNAPVLPSPSKARPLQLEIRQTAGPADVRQMLQDAKWFQREKETRQ